MKALPACRVQNRSTQPTLNLLLSAANQNVLSSSRCSVYQVLYQTAEYSRCPVYQILHQVGEDLNTNKKKTQGKPKLVLHFAAGTSNKNKPLITYGLNNNLHMYCKFATQKKSKKKIQAHSLTCCPTAQVKFFQIYNYYN